jgi:hypothetical protein
MGNQVESLGAIEGPQNVEMREALDIGEPGLEFAQDLEYPLSLVFGAKTPWN